MKVIGFEKDILKLAARDSGYSENELKIAYDTFCVALKKAVSSGKYTNITLPIGELYIDRDKVENPRPSTPLGVCSPSGDVRDMINIMKVDMGLTNLHVYKKRRIGKAGAEMRRIKCTIEEIEEYQNGEFKKNNL